MSPPTSFARTLRDAHVDSVTVFAVCHHGMCYYPSKVGTMHPHLRRDLLGEQVEACHRHGIRTPAYITVVWNEEQNVHDLLGEALEALANGRVTVAVPAAGIRCLVVSR